MTCAFATAGVAAAGFPATLEVDLISPRNETYGLNDTIPIVLAVQNSYIAAIDHPQIWSFFYKAGNYNSQVDGFSTERRWHNYSERDPYFLIGHADPSEFEEGHWAFRWNLVSSNCSDNIFEAGVHVGNDYQWGQIDLTIQSGGQAPDLMAATAPNMCNNTVGFTMNVTGLLKSSFKGDECLALDSAPASPSPNPCAVQIDSGTAASIAASMCAAEMHRGPTCHAEENSAAWQGVGSTTWMVATMGWVAIVFIGTAFGRV